MKRGRIGFFSACALSFALAGCAGGTAEASSATSSRPLFGSSSSATKASSLESSSDIKMCVLTWNVKGGDYIEPDFVPYGTILHSAPTPTHVGYDFIGWFVDKAMTTCLTFPYTVVGDAQFFAGWIAEKQSFSEPERSSEPEQPPIYDPSSMYDPYFSRLETDRTFVVDSLPEWAGADGKLVFAWAWPMGMEGCWYECETLETYDNGAPSVVSFSVSYPMAGLLLVSCRPGTTMPSWMDGSVTHQTYDIDVIGGVDTYSAPEEIWRIYY